METKPQIPSLSDRRFILNTSRKLLNRLSAMWAKEGKPKAWSAEDVIPRAEASENTRDVIAALMNMGQVAIGCVGLSIDRMEETLSKDEADALRAADEEAHQQRIRAEAAEEELRQKGKE